MLGYRIDVILGNEREKSDATAMVLQKIWVYIL